MIHIVTDSTSDLNPEMIKQYDIGVVPLGVTVQDKIYRDQIDITIDALFQSVKETGQLPKTSAPAVAEFLPFFDRPGEVIFIGISSQLSATVQNAIVAAETLGKPVRIIDSLNLSTGAGHLVMLAAELRQQGCDADEIERAVRAMIPKLRSSFTVDTLDYLYKGGRCTAMESVVASLLKIRPVIDAKPDGTLGVKDKLRGSRIKALNSMLEAFKADLDNIDPHRVFITHTGCHQDAEYLRAEIARMVTIEHLDTTLAGCVVASHCGPDTIGILYRVR